MQTAKSKRVKVCLCGSASTYSCIRRKCSILNFPNPNNAPPFLSVLQHELVGKFLFLLYCALPIAHKTTTPHIAHKKRRQGVSEMKDAPDTGWRLVCFRGSISTLPTRATKLVHKTLTPPPQTWWGFAARTGVSPEAIVPDVSLMATRSRAKVVQSVYGHTNTHTTHNECTITID